MELGGRRSETPESIGRYGTRDQSGVSNAFMDSYIRKADRRYGILNDEALFRKVPLRKWGGQANMKSVW